MGCVMSKGWCFHCQTHLSDPIQSTAFLGDSRIHVFWSYKCLCGQAASGLSGPGFATEEAEELAVEMGVVIPSLRGTKKQN